MEKHSRGLGCLVLLAVTLAVLLRPVPFREFAHSDRATEFYITAFVGDLRRTLEARPDQAEIAPLLAELETGTVSFCGRQRNISWSGDQQVYNLWLNHAEGDRGVLDAAFSLRSDGLLYTPLYLGDLSLGYACYQLKGCDLAAAVKQLNALLALPPAQERRGFYETGTEMVFGSQRNTVCDSFALVSGGRLAGQTGAGVPDPGRCSGSRLLGNRTAPSPLPQLWTLHPALVSHRGDPILPRLRLPFCLEDRPLVEQGGLSCIFHARQGSA